MNERIAVITEQLPALPTAQHKADLCPGCCCTTTLRHPQAFETPVAVHVTTAAAIAATSWGPAAAAALLPAGPWFIPAYAAAAGCCCCCLYCCCCHIRGWNLLKRWHREQVVVGTSQVG
jgi:hypothetical protein